MSEKEEETQPTSTFNPTWCKWLSILAILVAVGLIIFVLTMPGSPFKGGKKRRGGAMRGGCMCTPPGSG